MMNFRTVKRFGGTMSLEDYQLAGRREELVAEVDKHEQAIADLQQILMERYRELEDCDRRLAQCQM